MAWEVEHPTSIITSHQETAPYYSFPALNHRRPDSVELNLLNTVIKYHPLRTRELPYINVEIKGSHNKGVPYVIKDIKCNKQH